MIINPKLNPQPRQDLKKDHLGNVRVTFSDIKMPTAPYTTPFEVDLLSKSEYFPYGMQIEELGWNALGVEPRYSYNSQEKDLELNKNMLSAEFWEYDARRAGRWNQDPKPFANFSNYATFQNNPIKFSDPFGDIVKVEGELAEGVAGPQTEFANIQRTNLNKLQEDEKGKIIYDKLQNSQKVYEITPRVSKNGDAEVRGLKMFAGKITNKDKDLLLFGHEVFHFYQQELGQGSKSIETELEAYLFTNHLARSLFHQDLPNILNEKSSFGMDFKTNFLKTYELDKFNYDSFKSSVSLFKKGSYFNSTGVYNNYKTSTKFKPVIDNLYPLSK